MSEPNYDHFENEWKMAFEDKELMPSEAVWKEVELHIAKAENTSNKKRILFFQLLAAASVSFAMVVGTWQLYDNYSIENDVMVDFTSEGESGIDVKSNNDNNSKLDENNNISENKNVSSDGNINDSMNSPHKNSNELVGKSSTNTKGELQSSNTKGRSISDNGFVKNNTISSNPLTVDKEENSNNLIAVNNIRLKSDKDYLDSYGYDVGYSEPGQTELYMVPWIAYANSGKKKKSNNANSLWTGLNMSAGTFNPNSSDESSSPSLVSQVVTGLSNDQVSEASNQNLNIGSERSGSSYGVGLNIGKQLTDKIVVLSGLNYLQQNTTNTSNLVQSGARTEVVSSLSEIRSESQYATTEDYEIKSTYETISLPIQAGYYVLDKKFNILFLGGVANDFFIKRVLTDASGQNQSNDVDYNDNGYSLYSIGGLVATQFSYDIGDNYSIALQPQYKQMLNSFTPDGNKPSSFEVGFRFNYRIK